MNRADIPGFDEKCPKKATRTERVAYLVNM